MTMFWKILFWFRVNILKERGMDTKGLGGELGIVWAKSLTRSEELELFYGITEKEAEDLLRPLPTEPELVRLLQERRK